MNPIIHEINLNLAQPNNFQYIHAMQGDYDSVLIKATLYDGNNLYSIKSSTAALSGNLPDGTFITENVSIIDEHTIQFSLSKKLLMLDGNVRLVVNIITNGKHLSTFPFIVKVIKSPDGDISDSDLASLKDYLEKAEYYATLSQSYAVDGTGLRDGEKTDNSKYYYEQAKSIYENFVSSGGSSSDANILYFETYDEYTAAKKNGDVLPETLVLINGGKGEEGEKLPDEDLGNVWITVRDASSINYSTDNGLNWSKSSIPVIPTSSIEKINNIIVFGGSDSKACYSRDNGITWNLADSGVTIDEILKEGNKHRLLGVGVDSSKTNMYINYTEDGIDWHNLVTIPSLHRSDRNFHAIEDFYKVNNIYYLAIRESFMNQFNNMESNIITYYSTDLASWSTINVSLSDNEAIGGIGHIRIVYYKNFYVLIVYKWISISSSRRSIDYIYISSDGFTFSEVHNFQGNVNFMYHRSGISKDGVSYSKINACDPQIFNDKIYIPGYYINSTNANFSWILAYSDDGKNWNTINFPYEHFFVNGNKAYALMPITVGENVGTIYTSDDCVNWAKYNRIQSGLSFDSKIFIFD